MSVESILERMAVALENLSFGTSGAPEGTALHTIIEEVAGAPDYDALVAANDRDELLRLCGEKSVPVPPRTKTPTLAKLLTEADAAAAAKTDPVEEVNPFADDTAPEIDYEAAMAALKEVHKKDGVERVMEILKKQGGGVEKMSALQPEFFKAVYDEAKK